MTMMMMEEEEELEGTGLSLIKALYGSCSSHFDTELRPVYGMRPAAGRGGCVCVLCVLCMLCALHALCVPCALCALCVLCVPCALCVLGHEEWAAGDMGLRRQMHWPRAYRTWRYWPGEERAGKRDDWGGKALSFSLSLALCCVCLSLPSSLQCVCVFSLRHGRMGGWREQ